MNAEDDNDAILTMIFTLFWRNGHARYVTGQMELGGSTQRSQCQQSGDWHFLKFYVYFWLAVIRTDCDNPATRINTSKKKINTSSSSD